jgi:adenosine deaminase
MNINPSFPLIDLHRHLDGSVRLETILDLGRQYNLPLPAWDVESLRPFVQVIEPQPGIMAFISKFKWMTGVLVDYSACRRIAYENVVDARTEGLDYVELRFSPWFMAEPFQLDPVGIIEAVTEGVAIAVRETRLKVNLIGILSRHYGVEIAWRELDAIIQHRTRFIAVDLAGDEANYPGGLFKDHLRQARDAGLGITIHAGEATGPESVWLAIRELGAARIGHAVRALEDLTLMAYMKEQGIGIEANLTSNVQTSTVRDYASHPLKKFLEFGLLATINTDDPGISGIDINFEYEIAAPAAGLSREQIHQAQLNALEIAFLTPVEKEALKAQKKQAGQLA